MISKTRSSITLGPGDQLPCREDTGAAPWTVHGARNWGFQPRAA